MQNLQFGQQVTALDLAAALAGEEGTFLCQQAGQTYLVVAKQGHSIASIIPVGQRQPVFATNVTQPWSIERISNQEISLEGYVGNAGNRTQQTQQSQQR